MGDVRLGIVCGLRSEAEALGIEGAAVSGARPDAAEREARRLATGGVCALLSVGLAGGLAPAPAPGALRVPAAVLDGDTLRPTDAGLALRLGLPVPTGLLLGSDTIVASAAEKASLHQRTRADAVDMESHRVARVAGEAGLPFLAIRVIADPCDRGIPVPARASITADGRVAVAETLARLAIRPWELPALIRLGRDSARAHAELRKLGETLRRAIA
jgi:hopanoid-associated phosphorylase